MRSQNRPTLPTSTTQDQQPSNRLTVPKGPGTESYPLESSSSSPNIGANSHEDGHSASHPNSSHRIQPNVSSRENVPGAQSPSSRRECQPPEVDVGATEQSTQFDGREEAQNYEAVDHNDAAQAADVASNLVIPIVPPPVQHNVINTQLINSLEKCLKSIVIHHSGASEASQLRVLNAILSYPPDGIALIKRKGNRPNGGIESIRCLICASDPNAPLQVFEKQNPTRRFAEHLLPTHFNINKPFKCFETSCNKFFALPQDRDRHEKKEHRMFRQRPFAKLRQPGFLPKGVESTQPITASATPIIVTSEAGPSTAPPQNHPSTSKVARNRNLKQKKGNRARASGPNLRYSPFPELDYRPTGPPSDGTTLHQGSSNVVPFDTRGVASVEGFNLQAQDGGFVSESLDYSHQQVPSQPMQPPPLYPFNPELGVSLVSRERVTHDSLDNTLGQGHIPPGLGLHPNFTNVTDPNHSPLAAICRQTQLQPQLQPSVGEATYNDAYYQQYHRRFHQGRSPQNGIPPTLPSPATHYVVGPSHGLMGLPTPQGRNMPATSLPTWMNGHGPTRLNPYMPSALPNGVGYTDRPQTQQRPDSSYESHDPHDPHDPTEQWPGSNGNGSGPRSANPRHWRSRLYSSLGIRIEGVSSWAFSLFQSLLTFLFIFTVPTGLTTDSLDLRSAPASCHSATTSHLSRLSHSLISCLSAKPV
ncbi:hypothetical protein M408DRAFT_328309, partial [Serendipita vermifera MAFF 305830]